MTEHTFDDHGRLVFKDDEGYGYRGRHRGRRERGTHRDRQRGKRPLSYVPIVQKEEDFGRDEEWGHDHSSSSPVDYDHRSDWEEGHYDHVEPYSDHSAHDEWDEGHEAVPYAHRGNVDYGDDHIDHSDDAHYVEPDYHSGPTSVQAEDARTSYGDHGKDRAHYRGARPHAPPPAPYAAAHPPLPPPAHASDYSGSVPGDYEQPHGLKPALVSPAAGKYDDYPVEAHSALDDGYGIQYSGEYAHDAAAGQRGQVAGQNAAALAGASGQGSQVAGGQVYPYGGHSEAVGAVTAGAVAEGQAAAAVAAQQHARERERLAEGVAMKAKGEAHLDYAQQAEAKIKARTPRMCLSVRVSWARLLPRYGMHDVGD